MALDDASRLLDLPRERWQRLGARLRDLGFAEACERIGSIGGQVFDPLCRPLRRWYARRMPEPLASAVRLFLVDDPVEEDAARAALGEVPLAELIAAGFIARDAEGRLRCPLRLRYLEDYFILSDDLARGGDAVMGAGTLTLALLRAALPAEAVPSGRALEIGCGAGLNALGLARRFGRVVGTDINPRAIAIATINAALNGVENVEFRLGDLFAPVGGERFDVILGQPPFIPMPDGAAEATYMYGGRRGDEIPLRMLAGSAAHLAPGGRALFAAEWAIFDDEPVERRVRAVVGPEANLLVFEADGPDLDAFCVGDTAYEHPDFGPDFERKVIVRREHLERLGVQSIRCSIVVVVARGSAEPAWTSTVELADAAIAEPEVRALLGSFGVLARGESALLRARIRVRAGVAFAVSRDAVRVLFPPGASMNEVMLNPGAHRLLMLLDSSANVQAAVKRFAKEGNYATAEAQKRVLPAIAPFIRAGIGEATLDV